MTSVSKVPDQKAGRTAWLPPLQGLRWHGRGAVLLGQITGAWLGLFPLVEFLLRPHSYAVAAGFDSYREAPPLLAATLVAVILLGAAPAIVGDLIFGLDFRRARYLFPVALLTCLSIPLSFWLQIDTKELIYIVIIYFVFFYMVVGSTANIDPNEFIRGIAESLVLVHTLIMAAVLIDHDAQWGRLFGRNSPAYWGMVAQTTIIASLALRGKIWRTIVILLAVAVLYWSQTRGSMVALAAGLIMAFGLFSIRSPNRVWLWLLASMSLVLAFGLGVDFLANDLLKISDPARGVGSGLTGRASAWRETYDLFASHPFFGVGYRQHEQYLTSAVSAHNAYLATLADTGIFGTLAYMLLLMGGFIIAFGKALAQPSQARIMTAAFLAAYLVNGLFERSALNTGNTYSMLMILLCVWSWRDDAPGGYAPRQVPPTL